MTADMMCEYKVIRVVTADILGQAQLGLLSFRYDALFTVYKFRTCDEKSRRTRLPRPPYILPPSSGMHPFHLHTNRREI